MNNTNQRTDISNLSRVTLKKKKDSNIILLVGSLISVFSLFIFGWIVAVIVVFLSIGFSIRRYKVRCKECDFINHVTNNAHSVHCSKCKSLILIDWTS